MFQKDFVDGVFRSLMSYCIIDGLKNQPTQNMNPVLHGDSILTISKYKTVLGPTIIHKNDCTIILQRTQALPAHHVKHYGSVSNKQAAKEKCIIA